MSGTTGQPSADRERRVRQEAYRIWEEAGHPEGRAEAHWAEAVKSIEKEDPNGRQQPGVPTEAELRAANAEKKQDASAKPGGRKRKPVSPGG